MVNIWSWEKVYFRIACDLLNPLTTRFWDPHTGSKRPCKSSKPKLPQGELWDLAMSCRSCFHGLQTLEPEFSLFSLPWHLIRSLFVWSWQFQGRQIDECFVQHYSCCIWWLRALFPVSLSDTECEKRIMLEGHAFLAPGTNIVLFSGHNPMYPNPPNPEQLLLGTSSSLWTRRSSLGFQGRKPWKINAPFESLATCRNLTLLTRFELGTAWPFTAGVPEGSYHGRFTKGAKHRTEYFIVGYVRDHPTLTHENNADYSGIEKDWLDHSVKQYCGYK